MDRPTLDTLRKQLAQRQRENAELEFEVGAFESELKDELAPIQEEVLRLQMKRLKSAAQARMESARLRNAYHAARDAYESFRDRTHTDSVRDDSSSMKVLFRRASKSCHPDAVPDAYREEAAGTFRALESAYEERHRSVVSAIADSLERWGFPGRGETRSAERLQEGIDSLAASIESLRDTESYHLVQETADLEAAIAAHKRKLARRLREMRRGGRGRSRRL